MMTHAKTWALGLSACLLLLGCRADQVDIGKTGVLGAELSDYAGTWHGYAEAYKFSDGTDSVHLKLQADGSGVLEVGEAAAFTTLDPTQGEVGKFATGLVSGFSYAIQGAKVEAQRIRLEAHPGDVYHGFCSGLTPKHVNGASAPYDYNCVGSSGWSSNDGVTCTTDENEAISCALAQCIKVCACTATECAAADQGRSPLDGALTSEGNELVGTLIAGSERVTVRLSRM